MVYVPSARKFGFDLRLNEPVMRDVLNGEGVKQMLHTVAVPLRAGIEAHVRATVSPKHANNYVESMFMEDSFSDDYGFDFDGPYELGNRPIVVVGVHGGRGSDPSAKPPLMVEAETHALTSQFGVTVGGVTEDIR